MNTDKIKAGDGLPVQMYEHGGDNTQTTLSANMDGTR